MLSLAFNARLRSPSVIRPSKLPLFSGSSTQQVPIPSLVRTPITSSKLVLGFNDIVTMLAIIIAASMFVALIETLKMDKYTNTMKCY